MLIHHEKLRSHLLEKERKNCKLKLRTRSPHGNCTCALFHLTNLHIFLIFSKRKVIQSFYPNSSHSQQGSERESYAMYSYFAFLRQSLKRKLCAVQKVVIFHCFQKRILFFNICFVYGVIL